MDTKQPEALRLASELDGLILDVANGRLKPAKLPLEPFVRAHQELRRQHARITELEAQHLQELCSYRTTLENLEAQLAAVGAGGVGPLMGASQAQPVGAEVWQKRYATDPAGRWQDTDAGDAAFWSRSDGWEVRALYAAPQPAAQALDADLWYLQDTRSYVGNDVLWWAKDGKGYTTDVSKAHVYGREEAFRQAAMRGTDRAWPKSYIDSKTRPAVDMQYIDHAAAIAAKQGASNG